MEIRTSPLPELPDIPLLGGIKLPDGKSELKLDGSGSHVKHKWITIKPTPGFSVKTKTVIKNLDKKVFINLCYDSHIKEPGQKKKLNAEGIEEEGINIPLSVGLSRCCPDKRGKESIAVDVVVNPNLRGRIATDSYYRHFICGLLIECVEQKYKIKLDRKYKLPRVEYFGFVNSKTGAPSVKDSEFAEVAKQAIRNENSMVKIEEIPSPSLRTGKLPPKNKEAQKRYGKPSCPPKQKTSTTF